MSTEHTLATPANMRAVDARPGAARAVAFSPTTGEEYSATAGDYWNRPDNEPLLDSTGREMILVVSSTVLYDALTGRQL